MLYFSLKSAVGAGDRKEKMGKYLSLGCFCKDISVPILLCPRL